MDENAKLAEMLEEALPEDKRRAYIQELEMILDLCISYTARDDEDHLHEDLWKLIHATPSQRVEAVLRVIEVRSGE